MKIAIFGMILMALYAACGPVHQPESIRYVAAFEVPLPSAAERHAFIAALRRHASLEGLHVDAMTDEDLQMLSQVSPLTMNATIWRGEDVEAVASSMNPPTRPEMVWISFYRGEKRGQYAVFRQRLMREIYRRWPTTLPLPITPSGGIPSPEDMLRTPSGYVVKPSEKYRYEEPNSPLAAPR